MQTNDDEQQSSNDLEIARGLLREALDHVSAKPWDDATLLHARISEFLGVEPEYADFVEVVRRQNAE